MALHSLNGPHPGEFHREMPASLPSVQSCSAQVLLLLYAPFCSYSLLGWSCLMFSLASPSRLGNTSFGSGVSCALRYKQPEAGHEIGAQLALPGPKEAGQSHKAGVSECHRPRRPSRIL